MLQLLIGHKCLDGPGEAAGQVTMTGASIHNTQHMTGPGKVKVHLFHYRIGGIDETDGHRPPTEGPI